jgi:mediator of RNA polymerase II transcription subunit 13
MSRRFFEHGEPVKRYFQDPAYTLARPIHPTVKYIKRSKAPLDVVDAGTFLHVGYGFSECGKWILCACVDQRGEAHDLAVWLTQTQTPNPDGEETDVEMLTNEEYAVRKVWDFACQFAKRANVAWRIVFSKLGSMAIADLEGKLPYFHFEWCTYNVLSVDVVLSKGNSGLHCASRCACHFALCRTGLALDVSSA